MSDTLMQVPHGGALPPHLVRNRPFLLLVLSVGAVNLAFWSFFGAVFAEAAFRFDAGPAQMAWLIASFSLPFIALTPFQGALVDRWSPKWLTVIGYAVASAGIPVAMTARSLLPLYVASLMDGIGVAAVLPARAALTGLLVEHDRLVQANGMLSAALQTGVVFGPLTGGFLLRSFDAHVVYAASLVPAVAAVALAARMPDRRQHGERPGMTPRDLARGAVTAWRTADLRLLLFLAAVAWLVVHLLWTLEALFLKDTLHRTGDAIQFVWSAHGVGAVAGSLAMARMRTGAGRELRLIGGGLLVAGTGIVLYLGTTAFPVALVGNVVFGIGLSLFMAPANALIQRLAPEEERGRVTGVFAIQTEAMALVASLGVIAVGGLVVVRPTLLGAGVALAAVGLLGLVAVRRGR